MNVHHALYCLTRKDGVCVLWAEWASTDCGAEGMGSPLIFRVAGKINPEQNRQAGAQRVLLPEHSGGRLSISGNTASSRFAGHLSHHDGVTQDD